MRIDDLQEERINIPGINVYEEVEKIKKTNNGHHFFNERRYDEDYYRKLFKDLKDQELDKYLMESVLRLLKICGLDIDIFAKSKFYNNVNVHRLLETIHGVIYGYDINYCPVEGTPGITQIKTPNNCFMDLNSLHCELIDDVLVISDGTGIKHDFSTDEHDLIYMDGNKLPFIDYKFTDEELRKDEEELRVGFVEAVRASDRLIAESYNSPEVKERIYRQ